MTIDVWEREDTVSDLQNLRANKVEVFLAKLVNWQFAAANWVNV